MIFYIWHILVLHSFDFTLSLKVFKFEMTIYLSIIHDSDLPIASIQTDASGSSCDPPLKITPQYSQHHALRPS